MTIRTIMLTQEPTFDVRYGFQGEDGETSFEKEFDVTLSTLLKELQADEARDDIFFEGAFVDCIMKANSEQQILAKDILELNFSTTMIGYKIKSENKPLIQYIFEKFGNESLTKMIVENEAALA